MAHRHCRPSWKNQRFMTLRPLQMCVLPVGLLIFACCGCGGGTPSAPVAVKGSVSYQGQPLSGGIIVFTPDETRGTRGPLAHGTILADGTFELKADDGEKLVAGWYRISVICLTEETSIADLPENLLPAHYTCPDTSGLTRQIEAGKENVVHIDLQ